MSLDSGLDYAATQTTQVELGAAEASHSEIVAALKADPEFFMHFFISEQLTDDVPEFHKEIWGLLTNQEKVRILLAIPRGHNKTTLAKLAVVWYFLFTTHRFCVYLSNTNMVATNACKDILAYLRCDNFVNTFGRIKILKSSENDSLWEFQLIQANGKMKRCTLKGLGADQQVRGLNIDNQRPDLAVVDDVEDNKNTDTEIQQKKLDLYIYGPFLKALNKRQQKIIWLGNMLKKTSLLARQSRDPAWNPVVFGAIIKDSETGELKPLWPDLWTMEELEADLQQHRKLGLTESWMCEMMNMPGHGENGFTADQFNYEIVPLPDELMCSWITIDPAFGENAWNDKTAIVVHGIPKGGGPPMVLSFIHDKFDEVTMFNHALSLSEYWGCRVWGIEAIAAQKVLITLFNTLFAGRQMTGQYEMVPLMAGKGDPKVARIRAWVALMANKEYAIPEYDIDITTQALDYDMKKTNNKDDLIDSCAYGPQMMDLYLNVIIEKFNLQLDMYSMSQYGTEVEGV